jgi:UPF0755 protein
MKKKKRTRKGSKDGSSTMLKMAGIVVLVAALAGAYMLFTPMARGDKRTYVFVDEDDNGDSIYNKVKAKANGHAAWTFHKLMALRGFGDEIRCGRYEIGSAGALMTFHRIRNGMQTPVSLTIKSVRTPERLAEDIGKKMMFGKGDLLKVLTNADSCKKYGYRPETIIAMFIPNTYDVYWNLPVGKFMERMQKESKRFWTFERREKADAAKLSPNEVITLASIVDEETANTAEMPKIAGMYINRLRIDMPLQADPTVKYATKKFEARRIYNAMLKTDSPYNTYKYKGLPPGPIRVPSVAAIDAVLNYVHHDYLYMCAKEDFSGTHNFARTYEEHQRNAERYAKALNERGIK